MRSRKNGHLTMQCTMIVEVYPCFQRNRDRIGTGFESQRTVRCSGAIIIFFRNAFQSEVGFVFFRSSTKFHFVHLQF